MNDVSIKEQDSFSDKPKKRGRKPKKIKISSDTAPINPASAVESTEISPVLLTEEVVKQAIDNILHRGEERYTESVNDHFRETREDFENLQPVISEFLENFIIIGHTLDGQRVVSRYTKNPAGLDGLTELCKKVLIQMIAQERAE